MVENSSQWHVSTPEINDAKELIGVARDFANPLEALREAISNAFDAGAKTMEMAFDVRDMDGEDTLILRLSDDGCGMDEETLRRCFFGLGNSNSDGDASKIGEKGHGTKTFLNAKRILVHTKMEGEAPAIGTVRNPWASLDRREPYEIRTKTDADLSLELGDSNGTDIFVYGFNHNNRSKFTGSIIKDYVKWFSKIGSVEGEFGLTGNSDFQFRLKAVDQDEFEEISFGHDFPAESSDADTLFDEHEEHAIDYYVKKWVFEGRLECAPEAQYQMVVYVEGDKAKRLYNTMLNPARSNLSSGRYTVSSRYGVYLCKDFIPITNINDWVVGFGSGSNSVRTLLHGFINCQKMSLTANRGDVSFRQPEIQDELKRIVNDNITKIDTDLAAGAFHALRDIRDEERRKSTERAEYSRRKRASEHRLYHRLDDGKLMWKPENETETLSLFMMLHGKFDAFPELDPIDYNASIGVDMLAKYRNPGLNQETAPFYVEFKNLLNPAKFNHSWSHLRFVICWDLADGVTDGDECSNAVGDAGYFIKIQEERVWIEKPGQHIIKVILLRHVCEEYNVAFDELWSPYSPN